MSATRLQRGLRATFTGLAVNGLLAVGKLLGGIFGHSHALVADAVESFADLFSSLVVWQSLIVANKPAPKFPSLDEKSDEELLADMGRIAASRALHRRASHHVCILNRQTIAGSLPGPGAVRPASQ